MYIDYLTFSVPAHSGYGRKLRQMYYDLVASPASKPLHRRQIKGYTQNGLWVGYSDERMHLNISGARSDELMPTVVDALQNDIDAYAGISVSRLDLQQTFQVEFNVGDYIRELKTSEIYKKMVILSTEKDGSTGTGLYVGSSASDRRLRIYDKGAQIASREGKTVRDLYGSGGLLRVELVLRRQSAEKGLAAIVSGKTAELYTAYRRECVKRVPELDTIMRMPVADRAIDLSAEKLGQTEKWLLEQVMPALSRIYRSNKPFFDDFMGQLSDRVRAMNESEG